MDAQDRLSKKLETAKKEKRLSRKEKRSQIFNSKRNIVFKESDCEKPLLSDAEKLQLWRIEKKKRMDEEKLKKRPPFRTYIKVKHTGLSPYRNPVAPLTNKNGSNNIIMSEASRKNGFTFVHKDADIKFTAPVNKTTKITKPNPIQIESNIKKLLNTRITRQNNKQVVPPPQNRAVNKVLKEKNAKVEKNIPVKAQKMVTETERKAVRIVLPSTRVTRSTKKTDNDSKPASKIVLKKEPVKVNSQHKENNENDPILASKTTDTKERRLTRSRKNKEEAKPVIDVEPPNGPKFQRERLNEEIAKLQELKNNWLSNDKKNVPKEIYDEILSVTGLTTLLLTSKFEQFKTLINDCASQLANGCNGSQRITPDDLDGFWEMMYLQVAQLHNKYMRLEKLMLNDWIDPDEIRRKQGQKKPIVKTPMPKKKGKSAFQEFLAKQKLNEQKAFESNSSTGTSLEDIEQSNENAETEVINLDLLKNCRVTPKAVRNLITARKSRRSSMNLIMSISGLGKFDISGTAL